MTALQGIPREGHFVAMEIRVRGRVQGVGFRPTVWRIARELDLVGEVLNDAEGVLVRVGGRPGAIEDFIARLEREPPPLARIDRHRDARVHRRAAGGIPHRRKSRRRCAYASRAGRGDLRRLRPRNRRSVRAPLSLSLRQLHALRAAPQHRQHASPTIAPTRPWRRLRCARRARAEYRNPADRRFHAEAIACHCVRTEGEAGPPRRPRDELRPAFDARRRRRRPPARVRTAKSSPSRGSAAFTSPATRPTPKRSRACAG